MKKFKIALPIIIFIAAILCSFIYTYPNTIKQPCDDVDVAQSEAVKGYFLISPDVEEEYFEIKADDPRFIKLAQLLQEQKFRRSVTNIFPPNVKSHVAQDGDFKWEISLINAKEFSEKRGVEGSMVSINNFFGKLELRFDGQQWKCSVKKQKEFTKQVLQIIMEK